jgi:hypothetical protein
MFSGATTEYILNYPYNENHSYILSGFDSDAVFILTGRKGANSSANYREIINTNPNRFVLELNTSSTTNQSLKFKSTQYGVMLTVVKLL